MTHLSLGTWLGGLSQAQLERIITHRPEALRPRPARTFTELVARLSRRSALLAVLYGAPAPAAQVVEMIAAVDPDGDVALADVATGLGLAPDDPDLATVLDWLADRALVWRDGDTLCPPPRLLEAYPHPHHLGPPLRAVYSRVSAHELSALARAWGLSTGRLKADILAALVNAARDGGPVRDIVADAPAAVREMLTEVAWHGPVAPD